MDAKIITNKIIIIIIFIKITSSHTAINNDDVIITYSGHSDVNSDAKPFITYENKVMENAKEISPNLEVKTQTTLPPIMKINDDVIFIPENKAENKNLENNNNKAVDDIKKIYNIQDERMNKANVEIGT